MPNTFQVFEHFLSVFFVNIRYRVANLTVGLEVLPQDIDFVIRQNLVDLRQDTGSVFMYMDKPMGIMEDG